MSSFDVSNQSSASIPTPGTGLTTVYVDTDKLLKSKNDAGVVTNYGAVGSSITALTGEVTASGPGSAVATVTNSAVISKLLTGYTPTTGDLAATDSILQAIQKLGARQNCGWFPTASDGTVVYSVDTTLTRDVYASTIVVNSGVTVTLAGFRLFAFSSIENNGIIDRSGNPGVGVTAGAALGAGTLGGSGAGGAGGTAAGVAGAAAAGLGGNGGSGGLGSGGAGGAAGGVTVPGATSGGVEIFQSARQAQVGRDLANTILLGGAGGGGGGGDGTAGGGGGSGAGVAMICARNIFGTGTIRANGGNGGTPVSGNRGGGAGGGGGVVVLISENDTTATSLVVQVNGGIGSSGTGTGAVGNNGSVGRIFRVRV